MTRRTSVFALVAVLLVGSIVLAYVLDQPAPKFKKPTPVSNGVPSGLENFYAQKLSWSECGQAKCTRVEVPVDYEKPDGDTLSLAVSVIPSTGGGGRNLFVNPGGPGGAAISFAQSMAFLFPGELRDRYDIVGVDPRGVGLSAPIDCLSDGAFDTYTSGDPDPDNKPEIEAFRQANVKLGEGCREKSGELAAHVSTEEAARDMDVVRALLGSKSFDWYGASYGTQLGATYATLFPQRVGRMVLDGAVDPSQSSEESAFGQATGFQVALTAYIKDCVTQKSCPLGRDAGPALKRLVAFYESTDARPLRAGGPRELTQGRAFYGIAYSLYSKSQWPVLTKAIGAALKGDGSILVFQADQYIRRMADGSYRENLGEANPAINCLDTKVRGTLDDVERAIPRFEKASPLFGPALAWGILGCADWPIKATHPQVPIDAKGSAPIVVVGTTGDPATPYKNSRALADQLGTGVLLTRVGDGHTAYSSGNPCIKEVVDHYFVDGTVPEDGTTCKE